MRGGRGPARKSFTSVCCGAVGTCIRSHRPTHPIKLEGSGSISMRARNERYFATETCHSQHVHTNKTNARLPMFSDSVRTITAASSSARLVMKMITLGNERRMVEIELGFFSISPHLFPTGKLLPRVDKTT